MQSFLFRRWGSCTLIWFCYKKSACNSVLEGSFCIWVVKKVGQAMLLLQSFNGSYCSSVKAFSALASIIHRGGLHFHNIISTQKLMYSDRWFSTTTHCLLGHNPQYKHFSSNWRSSQKVNPLDVVRSKYKPKSDVNTRILF